MKLTKAQSDHIEKRIDEKLQRMERELTKQAWSKLPDKPDDSKYTKYKLIKAGKAKLKEFGESDFNRYSEPDLTVAYTYPGLDAEVKKFEATKAAATEKVNVAMAAKKKEANKLLDQIMLAGDAEGALALLEKFMSS